MIRSMLSLHIGVVLILLVCIADCLFLKDKVKDHSRQRRGFRMNTASRVAHGYGKRGYSNIFNDQSNTLSEANKAVPDFLQGGDRSSDNSNSPFLSAQDFSRLIQSNEQLADVIVRKFIDVNDDDLISTDELFRRIRE
uniref:Sensorin n=1 Tax=Tritonia tetraquetra TaxID=2780533 RepID=A0A1W5FND7_9GAST|nr:sensorin [Tritonia tetraquetra]